LLVGAAGESGSVSLESEQARFLDEQVLRVSGGLREVEEARARFWGGVREDGDGSDMVRYFQEKVEFERRNGNGSEVSGICKPAYPPLGRNLNLQSKAPWWVIGH
jgi:hypothetical protein